MISLAYAAAPTVCLMVMFCEAHTGHHDALTSRRMGRPAACAAATADALYSLNSAALLGVTARIASENIAARNTWTVRERSMFILRNGLCSAEGATRAVLCVSSP